MDFGKAILLCVLLTVVEHIILEVVYTDPCPYKQLKNSEESCNYCVNTQLSPTISVSISEPAKALADFSNFRIHMVINFLSNALQTSKGRRVLKKSNNNF